MCGIAGIVGTRRPDPEPVRRMCAALAHRGPDGEGYHEDEHAVLGVRRLAIVDVARGGQPVYSEDGTVVAVFNGEIYNFRALRELLRGRGHRFRGDGDTECLVHLYEEFGDDLVHHLRGMFAFAVWDARRRRLLLARDRLGKKPLFWTVVGNSVRFASELKALVRDPAVPRDLDPLALHHYLTYQYVPAPWSICRRVRKLRPGHLLVWRDGRTEERRYWRLDSRPRGAVTEDEAAERLRELLLDATRVRLTSERPVGVFLSGGLDSSAVVAAMARTGGGRLATFSVGFDDPAYDERRYARVVAERFGTDHHELVVTAPDAAEVAALARHFDEPFADSSAIPSIQLARAAADQVTVVLNGDGGDENFGGYRRYAAMVRAGRLPVPGFARPGLRRLGEWLATGSRARSPLRDAGRALQLLGHGGPRRYARLMSYFTPEQKHALYTGELRAALAGEDSYDLIDQAFAASLADSEVGRLLDVDINTYLPGDLLVKTDVTTSANSMEARSPFLDQRIIEWAAGLPGDLKVRSGTTKYLLRRAMSRWLPGELLDRPKMGFGVPLATWLRTRLRPLCWEVLTDETTRSRGLFRPEAVTRLLREHDADRDHGIRIWALLQFELWHRAHLDAAPGSAADVGAAGRVRTP